MILDKGRVCIIKKGRDFGRKVMVLEIKDNKVMVEGPFVKKRLTNVFHLWPLKETVSSIKDLSKIKY